MEYVLKQMQYRFAVIYDTLSSTNHTKKETRQYMPGLEQDMPLQPLIQCCVGVRFISNSITNRTNITSLEWLSNS